MAVSFAGSAVIPIPGGSIGLSTNGGGFTGGAQINTGNLAVGVNNNGLSLGIAGGGISAGFSLQGPAIGFGFSTGVPGGPVAGQTFRNQPIPNFRSALYQLVIRAPKTLELVFGFTFPISPSNIRKESLALSNVFDVASSDPTQNGVQRSVDAYGQTPPTYTIEGTTGFQYHGSDGYAMTGIESVQALQNVLIQYAQLNQGQLKAQIADLYSLEFYDYFTNDHWQVVPVGPQAVSQDARRPIIVEYAFRLVCLRNLAAPPPPAGNDPIAQDFSPTPVRAASTVSVAISSLNLRYGGVTLRTN